MARVVGIDLGTTNSLVAVSTRGVVETIPIDGGLLLPSVVSYRPDGTIMIGHQAKGRLQVEPDNTITACKRFMGDGTKWYLTLSGRVTPVDVSSQILKHLVVAAEEYLGEPIAGAVITVPAYFTEAQKKDTKWAAEQAGIRVLRLLPEPTAAAIAYGVDKSKDQTLLVYDLGGGTFDVSILQINGNEFIVKSIGGDAHLGGEDFDEAIMIWAVAEFEQQERKSLKEVAPAVARLSQQRLKEAAEAAKIALSSASRATLRVPDYVPGRSLDLEITLEQYNDLIAPYIARTMAIVTATLASASLTPLDIDRVVLVGGSTKNRAVRDAVKEGLKEPWIADRVDEVVAHGAAIVAADMMLPQRNVIFRDKTAHSLGVNALDKNNEEMFLPIIPRLTEYPCRYGYLGSTNHPMQNRVRMKVFRGEDPIPENNTHLGELPLHITRPRREVVLIGIIFELDSDGIIHFTAVEFPPTEHVPEIFGYALRNAQALDLEATDRLIATGRAHTADARIHS